MGFCCGKGFDAAGEGAMAALDGTMDCGFARAVEVEVVENEVEKGGGEEELCEEDTFVSDCVPLSSFSAFIRSNSSMTFFEA